MSLDNRLQVSEYTNENRCTPCTVVNLLIATIVGALATVVSTLASVGVFVLSVDAIYFWGYLVPGTPMLTKCYFPERVFHWFDKDTNSTAALADEGINIDPEQILLDADAVEPCRVPR